MEYKTRRWDIYNLDLFIIEQVANGVPIILEGVSEDNKWYKDVDRLGVVAKELSDFDYCEPEIYEKRLKEFGNLFAKNFTHLWY